MSTLRFGHARTTWAGSNRDEIPSRYRAPAEQRDRFMGLLHIELPGCSINWTLAQDQRDLRRFRAVDLEGIQHQHCAPRELLRRLALDVPRYSGATD